MKSMKLMGVVLAAMLGGSTLLLAEEAQPDAKAAKAEQREQEKALKEVRFLPYRQMKSLTAEQKAQIVEIHQRYLAEKKALEEREEAEITAVLTPEQVNEIKEIEATRAVERKAKEAERREQMKQEAKKEAKGEGGE